MERRCAANTSSARMASLSIGTTTLAIKTTAARPQSPEVQKYATPLRIVSSSERPSEVLCITGSRLAGMYSSAAARSNAAVRETLAGRRSCKAVWQRRHCGCDPTPSSCCTLPHVWQTTSPACFAERACSESATTGSFNDQPVRSSPDGAAPSPPSISSHACQSLCGSKRETSASSTVNAPNANRPAPGITRARLIILTVVTSTPSMNTSIIPQGRSHWRKRMTRRNPGGTLPARNGSNT